MTGTHKVVPVTGRYEWGRLVVPVTSDRVENLEWIGPLHLVAFGRDESGCPTSWRAQDVLPWHEHPEAIIAPDWSFACPGVPHPAELPRHPIRWYAGFVHSAGQSVPVRDPDRPEALSRALVRLLGLVVLSQAEGRPDLKGEQMLELAQRGPVSPAPPRTIPGHFLPAYTVGTFAEETPEGVDHGVVVFGWYSPEDGVDRRRPALLIQRSWSPALGYSAEGEDDTLVVLYHQGVAVD